MTTNIDEANGTFILLACDGVNHITYPTHMKNNLQYHYMKLSSQTTNNTTNTSVISTMNINVIYELWHH